jgi:uncharacterized protein
VPIAGFSLSAKGWFMADCWFSDHGDVGDNGDFFPPLLSLYDFPLPWRHPVEIFFWRFLPPKPKAKSQKPTPDPRRSVSSVASAVRFSVAQCKTAAPSPFSFSYSACWRDLMKSFAIVVFLLTGLAVAQNNDKPLPRVVRVMGTADVKVVPDRAVIDLGVEKQNPGAAAAKQAADAASRKIIAALRANGVDAKDIQTTYLSLQPQSYVRKGVRISYFVATQTLTVTVRDLPRLDSLLEALIKAGGNRIDSIRYETSDLRKYRDQARDLAMKAAHEKADAMARALGQQIGKAQMIDEVPEYSYASYGFLSNMSAGVAPVNSVREQATAAGQQSISASVVVSFELM